MVVLKLMVDIKNSLRLLLLIIVSSIFFTPIISNALESTSTMVINPQTNKIYIFNENKTISILDGNNNKIISSINLDDEKSNTIDWTVISDNIPIIGTLGGIITLIIGLFTYRQSQILKKKDIQKEIVFPLIDEFDNKSPKMNLAKLILDDVPIEDNGEAYGYYDNERLGKVLIDHRIRKVDEPWDRGDGNVRTSFDRLLDFFVRLEFLQSIGLLTQKEINYFGYYIKKVVENPVVVNYIKVYEFPLKGILNSKLKS